MCRLALPVTLLYLVESLVFLSNSIYAGSLDDIRILSATGMAASVTNILGFALVSGFVSGFNILASMAIGAGNFDLAARLFNKV